MKLENKNENNADLIFRTIFVFIIGYFFYGYITDENAAGAGGYNGDFNLIWKNLNLYKNGILENLNNPEYTDSRFPFSYIFHSIINPFADNKESFRHSVFILSCLVPILFYQCLKQVANETSNDKIILVSSLILLSPYFRTSAYWGLGENYSFIFLCLSFLAFHNIKINYEINSKKKKNLLLIGVSFFSSLCFYFDQKLIIIPLMIYLSLFLMLSKYEKILFTIYYFIFSLPCLYLVTIWGSILPPDAADSRLISEKFNFYNLGYAVTIIAFYIFPFLILKNKTQIMKLKTKQNLIIIMLFIFYLTFLVIDNNFENLPMLGKGIFHKLYLIIFEKDYLRFLFTMITFLICFLILLIYFEKNYSKLLVFYFVFSSMIIFPFMQEYLDPLLFILLLTFLNEKILIDRNLVISLTIFYSLFLFGTKIYYNITL